MTPLGLVAVFIAVPHYKVLKLRLIVFTTIRTNEFVMSPFSSISFIMCQERSPKFTSRFGADTVRL